VGIIKKQLEMGVWARTEDVRHLPGLKRRGPLFEK
jgi:hypothetical protein